jgi:hypothetical protein
VQAIYQTKQYPDLNRGCPEEDAPWQARPVEQITTRNEPRFEMVGEGGCGAGKIGLTLARTPAAWAVPLGTSRSAMRMRSLYSLPVLAELPLRASSQGRPLSRCARHARRRRAP